MKKKKEKKEQKEKQFFKKFQCIKTNDFNSNRNPHLDTELVIVQINDA